MSVLRIGKTDVYCDLYRSLFSKCINEVFHLVIFTVKRYLAHSGYSEEMWLQIDNKSSKVVVFLILLYLSITTGSEMEDQLMSCDFMPLYVTESASLSFADP